MTTTSRPNAGSTHPKTSPRKSALGALLGGKPWDAGSNRDDDTPAVSSAVPVGADEAATVVVDTPAKVAVDFRPSTASPKVGASTGDDNGKVHVDTDPQAEKPAKDDGSTQVDAQSTDQGATHTQAPVPQDSPKRGFVGGMLAGLRQKRRLSKRGEQKTPTPQAAAKTHGDVEVPVSEDTVNFTTKHEYRRKHVTAPVVLESIPADDEDESCDTNISYTASADTTPCLDGDEDTRKIQDGHGSLHNADTRPLDIVTGGRDYAHDADTESVSIVGTESVASEGAGTAVETGDSPAAHTLPAMDDSAEDDNNVDTSEGRLAAEGHSTSEPSFETAVALPTVDADEEHTTVMSLPHVADLDAEETCVYVPLVSGPVAQARGAAKLELAEESSKEDEYWPQGSDYSATDTTSQFKQTTEDIECSLGTDTTSTTSQTTTDHFVEGAGELASAKPALFNALPGAEEEIFPVAAPRAAAVGFTPLLAALEETTGSSEESDAEAVGAAEDPDSSMSDGLHTSLEVESHESGQDTAQTELFSAVKPTSSEKAELLSSVKPLFSAKTETLVSATPHDDQDPVAASDTQPLAATEPLVSNQPLVSSETLASVDSELAAPDEPVNRIGERLDAEADELTEDTSALPLVGHAAILASRDRTVGAPWLPYKKLQKAPVFAPTRVMTGEDESWHDQVAALAHRFPNAYVASYWEADPENTTLPSEQALVVVRPESVADVLHAYPLLRVASVESVTFADSCRLSFEVMRILGRDKGARWQITSMDAYTGAVHGTVYIPTGKVFNEAHRLRVLNEYRQRRQHRWPTATQDISFSINLVRTPRKATA